ncbi:hypothetical protein [Streptomyces sp. NPDC097619]|uniref:hypothetical protein n=1 Tax=Streptomyces sp. NPDC097619 TaxID=3157228 RepID=UPI003329BA6C
MTADLEFAEAVSGLAPIALRAAATLRMADHIAAGHDTVLAPAERTGTDPDLLGRVLRFPAGADMYTLVNVVHNWNDEQTAAQLCELAGEAGMAYRSTIETPPGLRLLVFSK